MEAQKENSSQTTTQSHEEKLVKDPLMGNAVKDQYYSEREKLMKHWNEVAGKILVPERWSQEGFLKEWEDCSSFDALLAPNGVVSAREALVAQARNTIKKGCRSC